MSNYFKSETIIKSFEFLSKYQFVVIDKHDNNMGTNVEFSNGLIRIRLTYDYKENFFYFSLIKGLKTVYPNDTDFENIKTFYDLCLKNNLNFSIMDLMPNENQSSLEALEVNRILLEQHGDKILNGEEWF